MRYKIFRVYFKYTVVDTRSVILKPLVEFTTIEKATEICKEMNKADI